MKHDPVDDAVAALGRKLKKEVRVPISLPVFLRRVRHSPALLLRNVFQLFHDMVYYYVPPGENEYPNDPETIGYIKYDCRRLLVDDTEAPYFADRLFANRLINRIHSLKQGSHQNQIYLFEGPPGTGKSTFLNNLLRRLEQYSSLDAGAIYETVWRLDIRKLGGFGTASVPGALETQIQEVSVNSGAPADHIWAYPENYLEVPCPNHDHPILQIPKEFRADFLDQILEASAFKTRLFNDKEYRWVFEDSPCTICSSLYQTLQDRLGNCHDLLDMVWCRRHLFNRRLGEGVSVFNPGDPMTKRPITNVVLQNLLNNLFKNSNCVRYVYSKLAKTNNGVFAVMDVKNHNRDRMLHLHGIISDSVHKVEHVEEYIRSLFIAIINPEDEKILTDVRSYQDRIVRLRMPYVLDYRTETEIYRNKFGDSIDQYFLPHALDNFARIIIATRLQPQSESMNRWISNRLIYSRVCDKNLQLLKMEIYAGLIPAWLGEEDKQRFDAKTRRNIISEAEFEGNSGISGRQSLQTFYEFFSRYRQTERLITTDMVLQFFQAQEQSLVTAVPEGFFAAVANLYDYIVLQEVKEALYEYNREQISREILNYLFAINYDDGDNAQCIYTGDWLSISENMFHKLETLFLGSNANMLQRRKFRIDTHREYIAATLATEVAAEQKNIVQTNLFQKLYDRYADRLKDDALDPFIGSSNFRMAIRDLNSCQFKTYDARVREDVAMLMANLERKFGYTRAGAQQVCMHVLDKKLVEKFAVAPGLNPTATATAATASAAIKPNPATTAVPPRPVPHHLPGIPPGTAPGTAMPGNVRP